MCGDSEDIGVDVFQSESDTALHLAAMAVTARVDPDGVFRGHWVHREGRITGPVYGHEDFDDGEVVTTSPIVAAFACVVTLSGNLYILEDTDSAEGYAETHARSVQSDLDQARLVRTAG